MMPDIASLNIDGILEGRHASTTALMRYFTRLTPASSPAELDTVRNQCHAMAALMVLTLPDGPELSAGLRKLLEAKDCFVRAAL
jgi:hypothetical protein